MRKRPSPFTKTTGGDNAVSVDLLPRLVDSWFLACDVNRHSDSTLLTRRNRMKNFLWYLKQREFATCGVHELRHFFHYLVHGHQEADGRWGNPHMTQPTAAGTSSTYYRTLHAFFNWVLAEGEIEANPLERIPKPVDRPDQIQPFTQHQLLALLKAARKTRESPRRDEAIVLLLLDTGMRASEICALTCSDIDLQNSQCIIRNGKGGKSRVIPFSGDTKRALYHHMNQSEREDDAAVFQSARGTNAGDALTRNGLQQMMERLGKAASATPSPSSSSARAATCSPCNRSSGMPAWR